MASLSDFETWEAAKAYEETVYRNYGAGYLRVLLASQNVYALLKSDTSDYAVALVDAIAAGESLTVDPDTESGAANRVALESLITTHTEYATQLTSVRDTIYAYCEYLSYPFADKTESDFIEASGAETEELIIEDFSTALQKITLLTTNSIEQATTVTVQQRLSADGVTWADWEDCQHFYNVKENVITYAKSIGETTANYRQLKLVSKRNLGMSIE